MAFIDYGALLRVNGKFLNKNDDLFVKSSDTGYVCDKATYYSDSEKKVIEIDIMGNYYVYAGDENFLLCFYKGYFYVISNNKIIHTVSYNPFISETFYLDGYPSIKVESLDKTIRREYCALPDEYDRKYFYERYGKKKGQVRINRICKRHNKSFYNTRSSRWLATWDYNGNHYEVIFGYGIDPVESVWNRIKFDHYDFSDVERKIIDEWFKGN